MLTVRPSEDRGRGYHGWLDSRHTFSFANYYDPRFIGFRALLVLNEDRVAPGRGFPSHAHEDMEILSYVLEGAIAHKDSTGTGAVLTPGELQRMTAGTGVVHSEFNASKDQPLHFLQIWIVPRTNGLPPSYEQTAFPDVELRNRLRLVGSEDAREGSVTIHQDVGVYVSRLDPGKSIEHTFATGRAGWLQVARGAVQANGQALTAGDGAAITDEERLVILGDKPAEVLLFDLGA